MKFGLAILKYESLMFDSYFPSSFKNFYMYISLCRFVSSSFTWGDTKLTSREKVVEGPC